MVYTLTALVAVLAILANSLVLAYRIENTWQQPQGGISSHSASSPNITTKGAQKPQALRSEPPKEPRHRSIKRDLKDYERRGWEILTHKKSVRNENRASFLGQEDPSVAVSANYFKPRPVSYEASCPASVQVFLSIFGMEALAQVVDPGSGKLVDRFYTMLILTPKEASGLQGNWAEVYASVDSMHLIIAWRGPEGTSEPSSKFKADYSALMLSLWVCEVHFAKGGDSHGLADIPNFPLSHITLFGIKGPETIKALEDIKKQFSRNVNIYGGFSIQRPETIHEENPAAGVWASLIGIPEIGAVEQMVSDWSTYLPARHQIQSIQFNIHTDLDVEAAEGIGQEAIISISLGPGTDTSGYDSSEALSAAGDVMFLEGSEGLRGYPGIDFFEGSTLSTITSSYATGSKRKAEDPPPTYKTIKWLFLTFLGNVENNEIRTMSSGVENHLVLEDKLGTENQQILADFIYLSWMQSEGMQDLRDITFLRLSPNTESLIRKAYQDTKADMTSQGVLILWGRRHYGEAAQWGQDLGSEREINDRLLRQFAHTVEYGAIVKILLQRQRYPGIPPGFEIRSLEIGNKAQFKKLKGKGREEGPAPNGFAMLVRIGHVQDALGDDSGITGAPFEFDPGPIFDSEETPLLQMDAASLSPQLQLEVLNTIAIHRDDPTPGAGEHRNKAPDPLKQAGIEEPTPSNVFFQFEFYNYETDGAVSLTKIATETHLMVQKYARIQNANGRPPIPDPETILTMEEERNHYYRFHLQGRIRARPDRLSKLKYISGDFYFSPRYKHVVIPNLFNFKIDTRDLPNPGERGTKAYIESFQGLIPTLEGYITPLEALYRMISTVYERQPPEDNIPNIDIISIENLEKDTEVILSSLFRQLRTDRESIYLKMSLIDTLLEDHVGPWSSTSGIRLKPTEKKDPWSNLSGRETIISVLLATQEVSKVNQMILDHYKEEHIGDRILDNIVVAWRKDNDLNLVPQFLLVLRGVPEALKRSDMVDWMAFLSKAPEPGRELQKVGRAMAETERRRERALTLKENEISSKQKEIARKQEEIARKEEEIAREQEETAFWDKYEANSRAEAEVYRRLKVGEERASREAEILKKQAKSLIKVTGVTGHIIIGQGLISRINRGRGAPGFKNAAGQSKDNGVSAGEATVTLRKFEGSGADPAFQFPLGKMTEHLKKSGYLKDGEIWESQPHLRRSIGFIEPADVSKAGWDGARLLGLPGYALIANREPRVSMLVTQPETSTISRGQRERELAYVYEHHGTDDRAAEHNIRAIFIYTLIKDSIDTIKEIMKFRKIPCIYKSSGGNGVMIRKPRPASGIPGGEFVMDTGDQRDSIEWATLLGIVEITAIVELGLKMRSTQASWFVPAAIMIDCDDFYDMPMTVTVLLDHYDSHTGAKLPLGAKKLDSL
ncbi:hypothetical protein TWF718_009880 [Orbilia javanica]|uniref:Uncharacterized protein n=1 Tax=Orbilia javanica TaxID=47235 RepID=A0AAN8MXH6_9PEZI